MSSGGYSILNYFMAVQVPVFHVILRVSAACEESAETLVRLIEAAAKPRR